MDGNDADLLTFIYTAAERRRRTLALAGDFEKFKAERQRLLKSGSYRDFMASNGYDATCWEVAVAALKGAGVIS